MSIPYIGYLELEVELCGKVMPQCGVLVVKDPPSSTMLQVPSVLGMSIMSRCYCELFGKYGLSLFDLPSVVVAPGPIVQASQQCHQYVVGRSV